MFVEDSVVPSIKCIRKDPSVIKLRACLHGVGGTRSSGVGFFCFHALGDTKQKKVTPLDRGPPLHVNRVLITSAKKALCFFKKLALPY